MPRQRWGTFSVRDHQDAGQLVPEVLLYDRLIFPVPDGPGEEGRWHKAGWDPVKLHQRIAQMWGLAQPLAWNEERRERFQRALVESRARLGEAAENEPMPFRLTAEIVARDAGTGMPIAPEVVAAYGSIEDIRTQYLLAPASTNVDQATLTLALSHPFRVPAVDRDPEAVLADALNLARDPEFRRKRRDFYAWRERVLTGPASLTPAEAVEEMRQKLDDYNAIVSKAMTRTYWKFAFTIGGAALSTTAAVLTGNPLPAVGALWSVVQFARLDRTPVVQAGDSAPAAMFHDIQQHLG